MAGEVVVAVVVVAGVQRLAGEVAGDPPDLGGCERSNAGGTAPDTGTGVRRCRTRATPSRSELACAF